MKRKRSKGILAIVLVISILCACAGTQVSNDGGTDTEELSSEELEALLADIKPINRPFTGDRPFLVKSGDEQDADMAVPSVEAYTIAPDLSNVDNLWQFYLQDGFKARLAENGFVVFGEAGFEFYEINENNRYEQITNFVMVDSTMHTYHLYFVYLMKNVEKEYLYAYLTLLSRKMLESSVGQYELDAINQAEGIQESKITEEFEDYTQYKPRGYYEDDIRLERYYQAMMRAYANIYR